MDIRELPHQYFKVRHKYKNSKGQLIDKEVKTKFKTLKAAQKYICHQKRPFEYEIDGYI